MSHIEINIISVYTNSQGEYSILFIKFVRYIINNGFKIFEQKIIFV